MNVIKNKKKIIRSINLRKTVVVSVVLCIHQDTKPCQYCIVGQRSQSRRLLGNLSTTVTLDG